MSPIVPLEFFFNKLAHVGKVSFEQVEVVANDHTGWGVCLGLGVRSPGHIGGCLVMTATGEVESTRDCD